MTNTNYPHKNNMRDNLLALDSWQCQGAEREVDGQSMTLRSAGKLYACAWRTLEVNLDDTPILFLKVDRLTDIEAVEVRFRASHLPAPGYLLETKVPGVFVIPLRDVLGAGGELSFELGVGLRNEWGKGSATFAELRLLSVDDPSTGAAVATPELVSPVVDAAVTCCAVEFRWRRTEGAVAYELQVARDPAFETAEVTRVSVAGGGYYALYCDPIPFLPRQPFAQGRVHWRVRGLNARRQPGDWSTPRAFEVNADTAPRPRELQISPARPLVCLDNSPGIDFERNHIFADRDAECLTGNWQALPEDIRSGNVLINIFMDITPVALRRACEQAQAHGIPLLLQIGTWPGIIDMGRHRALSLAEAEWLLQNYSCVKAFRLVEQDIVFWGGAGRDERLRYVVRLVRLAAKYGKIVIWPELIDHWAILAEDQEFLSAIADYRDYFIPVWKATLPPGSHRAHSAVLGLWLAGRVSNWGVHADGWWWPCAGFAPYSRKATQEGPGSLYGLVWMTGLSAGATVYNVENFWNIWDPPGRLTQKFEQSIIPLIRALWRQPLIPERAEVQEKIRVVCCPDGRDVKPLFENSYTLRNPWQFIPGSGRYYWLPIVTGELPPELRDRLDAVVGPELLGQPEKLRALLDQCYPDQPAGTAWTARVGDFLFAMQSHENRMELQTFTFELEAPFVRLAGTLDSHGCIVARLAEGKLFAFVQSGRGQAAVLRLTTAGREPCIVCDGERGGVSHRWNAAAAEMEVRVERSGFLCIICQDPAKGRH